MTVDDRLFPAIQVTDLALLFVVGPGITLFPPIPIPAPTYLDENICFEVCNTCSMAYNGLKYKITQL